jgi:hypothetical protein
MGPTTGLDDVKKRNTNTSQNYWLDREHLNQWCPKWALPPPGRGGVGIAYGALRGKARQERPSERTIRLFTIEVT